MCRFFYLFAFLFFLISLDGRGDLSLKEEFVKSKLNSAIFLSSPLTAVNANREKEVKQFAQVKSLKTLFKKKNTGFRPNILLFIIDEQRYPVEYESDELKEWKRVNLPFQTMLAKKGTVFHNHYTNTNACCPARATLHTGQFPNVHGVTQTEGNAKPPNDPSMTWLKKFTVPTMGNYLREHGYRTILKGKWHVSNASIRLRDGSYLTTFDANGDPIPELYQFYLEKNVLHDFGYDGWIGPEPVGQSSLNSASSVEPPVNGRDVKITQQALEELDKLKKKNKPWLLITSYVDPHDITTYGAITRAANLGFYYEVDPTLPENLFKPEFQQSRYQSFADRPPVQLSYHDLYPVSFQPILDIDRYQRYYYTLQKRADEQMKKVWDKLVSTPMYHDTIIILTSDHGDLLASHGEMFQKWYQAFQEAIHVPLIISSPLLKNKHQDVYNLTSHIDLLPTILDFAQANPEYLRQKLGKMFSLNLPLSGKSLVPLIKHPDGRESSPVYFYTLDDVTSGPDQISLLCQPFDNVVQPAAVEAILTYIDGSLWKLTDYFNPRGDSCGNVPGVSNEMFNITEDPMELNNLFSNPSYSEIKEYLKKLLFEYTERYRTTGNPGKGDVG